VIRVAIAWVLLTAAASSAAPQRISIVGTNDWHGRLERVAVFAGFMTNLRARHPVVLLDAGDAMQGTLESNDNEGAAIIASFNRLGVSALAIGNHEFDFGPIGAAVTPQQPSDDPLGALRARAREASFPFLTANVWDRDRRMPVRGDNIAATTMVKAGAVRVGIVGVTTIETPTTTASANLVGVTVVDPIAAVIEQATFLRRNGAHVVVVAAHVGAKCAPPPGPCDNGEIVRLAEAMPAGLVDAIVAGHTHSPIAHVLNGIPVIESYANGKAFGRIDLDVELTGGRAKVKLVEVFAPRGLCAPTDSKDDPPLSQCQPGDYEGKAVTVDAAMLKSMQPALLAAEQKKGELLGVTLATEITRGYDVPSPLANLFADLMRASHPNIDVALMNGGGIRANLPAGPLSYGSVYLMMPFDNRLATMTMTGAQLRRLLERNLDGNKHGGLLAVSGVSAKVQCQGSTAKVVVMRDGQVIADDVVLQVLATDFMALGGDGGLGVPTSAVTVDDNVLLRDVLVSSLRSRSGTIAIEGPLSEARLGDGRCPSSAGR
jgi:2',3'-cyclic-nucleotide 2'-phosphodiesterase (5'-nucleotidase family)